MLSCSCFIPQWFRRCPVDGAIEKIHHRTSLTLVVPGSDVAAAVRCTPAPGE
jgi:hypothetical protein